MSAYRVLLRTRNAGLFESGASGSLTMCKRIVRRLAGCRLRWRQEGDDIAAYKSGEDMSDEDKAFARICRIEGTPWASDEEKIRKAKEKRARKAAK